MKGVLRFAQINPEGGVSCVCEMADAGRGLDGYETDEGVVFKRAPEGVDNLSLLTEWAYDATEGWVWLGERPSDLHVADFQQRTWRIDEVAARVSKKKDVEEIRQRKSFERITYDGITIDGDETSQSALIAKIEETRARLELSLDVAADPLIWRDAENTVHEWSTLTSFYAWLRGCHVALSNRNTVLRIAAWTHKEAIDELTGDALLAYDTTQGWPP